MLTTTKVAALSSSPSALHPILFFIPSPQFFFKRRFTQLFRKQIRTSEQKFISDKNRHLFGWRFFIAMLQKRLKLSEITGEELPNEVAGGNEKFEI